MPLYWHLQLYSDTIVLAGSKDMQQSVFALKFLGKAYLSGIAFPWSFVNRSAALQYIPKYTERFSHQRSTIQSCCELVTVLNK